MTKVAMEAVRLGEPVAAFELRTALSDAAAYFSDDEKAFVLHALDHYAAIAKLAIERGEALDRIVKAARAVESIARKQDDGRFVLMSSTAEDRLNELHSALLCVELDQVETREALSSPLITEEGA